MHKLLSTVHGTVSKPLNHNETRNHEVLLIPGLIILGSDPGADQAGPFINLVFGPSQKKTGKNLAHLDQPAD